jgi:hypothetical protein
VRIDAVSVAPDAVEALVVFEPGEPLRTSEHPGAGDRALALLPGLRGHACENDEGRPFSEELGDTELAHLLEHAALEIAAMAGSSPTLHGRTEWDFRQEGRGVFHVRLAYDDDLVALGALKAAERAVAWCVSGEGVAPDVEEEARRLRATRRRSTLTASHRTV